MGQKPDQSYEETKIQYFLHLLGWYQVAKILQAKGVKVLLIGLLIPQLQISQEQKLGFDEAVWYKSNHIRYKVFGQVVIGNTLESCQTLVVILDDYEEIQEDVYGLYDGYVKVESLVVHEVIFALLASLKSIVS